MPDLTDAEREQRVRESINQGHLLPSMAALLRLLDVERARADAAEAKVARLTSALDRTESNFHAAVRGLSVRDMAENLAENDAARK